MFYLLLGFEGGSVFILGTSDLVASRVGLSSITLWRRACYLAVETDDVERTSLTQRGYWIQIVSSHNVHALDATVHLEEFQTQCL